MKNFRKPNEWFQSVVILLLITVGINSQTWSGDTLRLNPVTFQDASPEGWNAQYNVMVDFPEDGTTWRQILMIQTLKCDSATAGDKYPCGEWDYIWNTLIEIPRGDTSELFTLGSFVTPYGKRLKLGGEDGWKWFYDITEYAPLLVGKRNLTSGNNQELLNLEFLFIKGRPARDVLSVANIYPYGDYKYELLATDSLLKEKEIVLSAEAKAYSLKAIISGHGHAGPRNCCEWDSKTHSYYINKWEAFRWNVWTDCGDNPIYPQGGTWPFDRAGWCPGTIVDEYEFEITSSVSPGDTVLIDYGIEFYQENGEKEGTFRMSHQLFSYGKPNFEYDASIVEILNPTTEDKHSRDNPGCGVPKIIIQNTGSHPLTQLSFRYGIKGTRQKRHHWAGKLKFLETEIVTLPALNPKALKNSEAFTVEIIVGKNSRDEYAGNNKQVSFYEKPAVFPSEVVIALTTNSPDRARENHCYIYDANGVVWLYEDEFKDSTDYHFEVDLPKGCFKFLFEDDLQDGISRHWWNRNSKPELVGNKGNIQLESGAGDTLVVFPADFGERVSYYFIVE